MLGGCWPTRQRLGSAQLEEHGGTLLGRWWLDEGPGEKAHGALGGALLQRRPCGALERVDHAWITVRLHELQVRGDLLGRYARGRQQRSRLLVSASTLERREVAVDGSAHEGVHEGSRRTRAEDLRAHERVDGARRVVSGEAGQR